jgi:ribosomal protein S18 acetylase RimI-like enzyme
MDNINIQRLKSTNISQLALLFRDFWNEKSDLQKMEGIFDLLKNNDNYIFLCAVKNNELYGYVMGIVCNSLYGNCEPFLILEDMIIDIRFRGKGIGKMLFTELENIARLKGCNQILLVTEEDRKGARSFYEKLGFEAGKHIGYKKRL